MGHLVSVSTQCAWPETEAENTTALVVYTIPLRANVHRSLWDGTCRGHRNYHPNLKKEWQADATVVSYPLIHPFQLLAKEARRSFEDGSLDLMVFRRPRDKEAPRRAIDIPGSEKYPRSETSLRRVEDKFSPSHACNRYQCDSRITTLWVASEMGILRRKMEKRVPCGQSLLVWECPFLAIRHNMLQTNTLCYFIAHSACCLQPSENH